MSAVPSLSIQAPAKINLFLQILGRRLDGYHDLYSLVQAVSLYDTLTFRPIDSGFVLTSDSPLVPADPSNLIWRAWELLKAERDIKTGLQIDLVKRIPSGAGLGGGSSDAAAALKGINQLLNLGVPVSRLAELGARLGSDVPFFFSSGSALITGRGERVEDIDLPLHYCVLLVAPDFAVATAAAYAQLRIYLTRFSTKSDIDLAALGADLFAYCQQIGNDFQPLVLSWHPKLADCLNLIQRAGAHCVALSGSGSSIFGLFDPAPKMSVTTDITSRFGWQVFCLSPVRLPRE